MRTFHDYIKNETLNEIKASLENLWKRTFRVFFQYSLLFVVKRKRLSGADRIRCRENDTPSANIYIPLSSRRYILECHVPMVFTVQHRTWATASLGGSHEINTRFSSLYSEIIVLNNTSSDVQQDSFTL